MSNRKEVTKWILDLFEELQPGNKNVKILKTKLEELSDTAFAELVEKLADGTVILPFYCEPVTDKEIPIENLISVGKKLGINFFQKLKLTDPVTGVEWLTPNAYMVLTLPARRQSQHVQKGKSVSENSNFIDSLTGQPTGPSKTSRMSLPELMNLDSLKLHNSIQELIDVRGGNELGFRTAKRNLINTGSFSIREIKELDTRVTSTQTLKSFLLGMHYQNNL